MPEKLADALHRLVPRWVPGDRPYDDEDLVNLPPLDLLAQRLTIVQPRITALSPEEIDTRPNRRLMAEFQALERQHAMAIEREQRARERNRPDGCWCLGLGGKGRRYLLIQGIGDEVDQQPFVYSEYCVCPEGQQRSAIDNKLKQDAANTSRRERMVRLWQGSGVPEFYAHFTLENYPQDDEAQRTTIKAIRGWLNEPALAARWLYLHGDPGRGKTSLACAITRHFVAKGIPCRFDTTPDMFAAIRAKMNEGYGKPEEMIQALIDIDILVLDDLGREKVTDYVREVLFRLIDKRKNLGKRTVITSNFDLRSLADKLSPNPADPPATPITSRILEMSHVVYVGGPSLR